jgi:hypothetical protein
VLRSVEFFATNLDAGNGGTLAGLGHRRYQRPQRRRQHGSGAIHLGGRTYVAINLANHGFLNTEELLLDITGATGIIGASNFI